MTKWKKITKKAKKKSKKCKEIVKKWKSRKELIWKMSFLHLVLGNVFQDLFVSLGRLYAYCEICENGREMRQKIYSGVFRANFLAFRTPFFAFHILQHNISEFCHLALLFLGSEGIFKYFFKIFMILLGYEHRTCTPENNKHAQTLSTLLKKCWYGVVCFV